MKSLLALMLMSVLIGCDSGGNGDGAPGYDHNELAKKFVQQLNLDPDFNVTLVKDSTLQHNYIVIYDPLTNNYDSINIGSYDPAVNNATDYYNRANIYFDLHVIPGGWEWDYRYTVVGYDYDGRAIWGYEPERTWVPTRYRDGRTGTTFEKINSTQKDLAKVQAIIEEAELDKTAKYLSGKFHLELERSQEVATLLLKLKKDTKKSMTKEEFNQFGQELFGFDIDDAVVAYQESLQGESTALDELIATGAETNGISPEHAQELISEVLSN